MSLPVPFMTLPARMDVLKTPTYSRLGTQYPYLQGELQREKDFLRLSSYLKKN